MGRSDRVDHLFSPACRFAGSFGSVAAYPMPGIALFTGVTIFSQVPYPAPETHWLGSHARSCPDRAFSNPAAPLWACRSLEAHLHLRRRCCVLQLLADSLVRRCRARLPASPPPAAPPVPAPLAWFITAGVRVQCPRPVRVQCPRPYGLEPSVGPPVSCDSAYPAMLRRRAHVCVWW